MFQIDESFQPFAGPHGVSSSVYLGADCESIFKVTDRNSVVRLQDDISRFRALLGARWEDRLVESDIFPCMHRGEIRTCVRQPYMPTTPTLQQVPTQYLIEHLLFHRSDIDFLLHLIDCFERQVETRELYPDIVGCPDSPAIENSVNLLLARDIESGLNRIVVCDIGLSPHEDTLADRGDSFYNSRNIAVYLEHMLFARSWLRRLLTFSN